MIISDPMAGYVPMVPSKDGPMQPKEFSPRVHGVQPGKLEQAVGIYPEVPLNFGTISENEDSEYFQVLIVNQGYRPLTLDSVEVVGDFSIGAISEMTIQPGGVLSVDVTFKPLRKGQATGAIYVNAGDAVGTRFLKLIGKAS